MATPVEWNIPTEKLEYTRLAKRNHTGCCRKMVAQVELNQSKLSHILSNMSLLHQWYIQYRSDMSMECSQRQLVPAVPVTQHGSMEKTSRLANSTCDMRCKVVISTWKQESLVNAVTRQGISKLLIVSRMNQNRMFSTALRMGWDKRGNITATYNSLKTDKLSWMLKCIAAPSACCVEYM